MKAGKSIVAGLVLELILLVLVGAARAAPENPSDVVISEIAWMGTSTSSNHEWVKLYNNTDNSIDLSGGSLNAAARTPSISLSGNIHQGGCFLLERTDDDSVPGVTGDLIYTPNPNLRLYQEAIP
jgi:hypothetical protein